MSEDEFDPPSPIRATQLDPEEAERLMQESELFTERSEFDNEEDLNMLRQGKYNQYIEQKLTNSKGFQYGHWRHNDDKDHYNNTGYANPK